MTEQSSERVAERASERSAIDVETRLAAWERRLDAAERSIRRQRLIAFGAGVACTLVLGASSATLIDRVVVEPGPRPLVVTLDQAKDATFRVQLIDDEGVVIGKDGHLPFED